MRTRWIQFLAVGAACAALGVGCGGDDEEPTGGSNAAPEAVTLKVGVIPIADVAPLYLGIKKGFFKEENLTIEPQLAEGGAAIIPSVMSGDYQIGFSNAVSLLIAASKNLPVQIISQGVLGGTSQDDAWDAVVVPKGSDVKTIKDLEGKTIAVNTLNNIGPVTINNAMEKDGADYKTVKYVEVPFPEMGAALEANRVDAAFTVEPPSPAPSQAAAPRSSAPTSRPHRTSRSPRTSRPSSTSGRTTTSSSASSGRWRSRSTTPRPTPTRCAASSASTRRSRPR